LSTGKGGSQTMKRRKNKEK